MRALIIGNGDIKNYDNVMRKIGKTDLIICADGGYNHAKKMGITPDVLIGDLDSAIGYENIKNRVEYPTRKDFTDGELAVMYAEEHGCDSVVMVGMTGDRLDHTFADIMLLNKCKNGVVIDDNNEIYLLRDRLIINGKCGQTLSIIPVTADARGISTRGLEYPLDNETLYFSSTRGISNVMTADTCEITIKEGLALVVKVDRV
ncbi:MAG: thiamine diphosphokinase [Clostridia bacterium]|nr:thiamine diphosphokinase [Clostridia bacterium]